MPYKGLRAISDSKKREHCNLSVYHLYLIKKYRKQMLHIISFLKQNNNKRRVIPNLKDAGLSSTRLLVTHDHEIPAF